MNRGFFSSLFDFSFRAFITPKIIGIMFMLIVIIYGVTFLFILIAGFSYGPYGVILVILAPVGFLLSVIFLRISFEMVMIFFKIYDSIQNLQSRGLVSSASASTNTDSSKIDIDI